MARSQRTVIEVRCDRCARVEEKAVDPLEKEGAVTAFKASLVGAQVVSFEDLCGPCYRTVKNHLEQIGKTLEGPSPDRVAKGTKAPVLEAEVLTVDEPVPSDTKPRKIAPSFLPTPESRSK